VTPGERPPDGDAGPHAGGGATDTADLSVETGPGEPEAGEPTIEPGPGREGDGAARVRAEPRAIGTAAHAATAGTVGIADRVLEIARTDPGRVALVHARSGRRGGARYRHHTYGELSARAEALAVGLRGIGVKEGTLCSFMVPPSFDALVLGVALWRVGAVFVGIEPHSHGLRRVARCLAQVEPEVFFGTPRAHLARVLFGWGKGSVRTRVVVGAPPLPGVVTLASLARGPSPSEPRPADVSPADPTAIAFTTGSTGAPKPTVMTQRNLAAMIDTVTRHWGLDDGREVVDMPTFPMFWIIGLSVGGTVVVPPMDFTLGGPADADPALLLRTLDDCRVTSMFGSPALLRNLSDHAIERSRAVPTLRRIVTGGAEVPGPLFARVRRMMGPGGEMYSDYGATEALPTTEIDGATVLGETWAATEEGAGLCAGHPLPGVEVRIVEISDGDIPSWDRTVEMAPGEIGEVVARGAHLSEGYHRSPAADAANKIADPTGRWHRLGDTGYLDDQGRLWVCGRRSHRVVTDDHVLYPLRCEPVFNAHPAVARSALVGLRERGRTVPAVCIERVRADGADTDTPAPTDAELEAELRARADAHEATRPVERFVFMERLPVDRRHNAKIDRPALAASLSRP